MTVAKVALAGLLIALAVGAIVLFWQYLLIGAVILLVALWLLSLANSQPASISPAEQERRRRSFVNYQISQDMAERREAHREAMAQWRQQQQPPPRDPANWGGGGGRYC
jgi:apolipoprotein N-acyltransferase